MYFVEISYSFDDDIVKSQAFETKALALNELYRLLFEEIEISVAESETSVRVVPTDGDTDPITLVYENDGNFATYQILKLEEPLPLQLGSGYQRRDHAFIPNELAYRIGDLYFAIHCVEDGYDYTIYDKNFKSIDGGVYDDPSVLIDNAINLIVEDDPVNGIIELLDRNKAVQLDFALLMERVVD